jgi:hypothetical protein
MQFVVLFDAVAITRKTRLWEARTMIRDGLGYRMTDCCGVTAFKNEWIAGMPLFCRKCMQPVSLGEGDFTDKIEVPELNLVHLEFALRDVIDSLPPSVVFSDSVVLERALSVVKRLYTEI